MEMELSAPCRAVGTLLVPTKKRLMIAVLRNQARPVLTFEPLLNPSWMLNAKDVTFCVMIISGPVISTEYEP